MAPAEVPAVLTLRRRAIAASLLMLFVIVPALSVAGVIEPYHVNRLGRYLCFAIVALGIDLVWGSAGILSLCQALFFCIGGYAIAMHLSLPQGGGDVRPEYHNIPQFFFFNNVDALPSWWRPFASFPFALAAGVLVPALVAGIFGFFIFRNRVRGVYFSIITQALAWGAFLAFSRNELLLGGTNGLTNFYKPLNSQSAWVLGLYLVTALVLVGCFAGFGVLTRSRAGRVLIAIRDNESRLRFFGYRPEIYKAAAFALAAVFAAVGGMLYVPQNGIITPNVMRVEDSLWMVIWVAVGGRGTRWGAVAGALLANFTYSILTSDMPRAWPFIQSGLFLAVLIFPGGIGSLWTALEADVRASAKPGRLARAAIPLLTVAIIVFLEAFDLLPRSLSMVKYVVIGTLIAVYALMNSAWTMQMTGMRTWVRHAE